MYYLDFRNLIFTEPESISFMMTLINGTERGFFQQKLKDLNILNRTRIYKDFSNHRPGCWELGSRGERRWVTIESPPPDKEEHIRQILSASTAQEWLSAACDFYGFNRISQIINRAGIDVQGLPVTIIRRNNAN
jgi:hypothetical protein